MDSDPAIVMANDDKTLMKEVRVVLTRHDDDAVSVNLSETESDMSLQTIPSRGSGKAFPIGTKYWKKRRIDVGKVGNVDVGGEEMPSSKAPATKGRGRPPTTGEYVGLAKAKADLNAAKAEALRLDAEREMAEELKQKREKRAAFLKPSSKPPSMAPRGKDNQDSLDLEELVQDSVETIHKVAKSSGHLQGRYVKALHEAADTIKASFDELRARTVTEEMAQLEKTNALLAAQLKELRKEVSQLRGMQAPNYEEIARAMMDQCGTMINARLENIEDRLLPKKQLRPPLAVDRINRKSMGATVTTDDVADTTKEPSPRPAETLPEPNKRKGKNIKRKAEMESPLSPPQRQSSDGGKTWATQREPSVSEAAPEPCTLPPRPKNTEEAWSTVTKKGKTNKKKASVKVSATVRPQKPMVPKLKPPRSAAVMLTLQPSAVEKGVTYSQVLAEARQRIALKDLGIEGVKFRTAVTGARLLEVSGATSAEKANILAGKIRETLGDDMVRVSRPEKCVEMRITGLDDATTKDEVLKAVSESGGCAIDAIRAGDVTFTSGRQGTIWLRCPIAAAKKVAEKKLLVGWVSVQVKILEAKPLRCYRCLEPGHVGIKCTSEVDRSRLCFCCGKAGHKASECNADPHCPVCLAANKAANHRIGGKMCSSTPSKRRRKGRKTACDDPRVPSQPAQQTCQGQEQMDTVI